MTVIRVIDRSDREELLCIKGDFRESDVIEAMQELQQKLESDRTVEDLVNLLREKGFTFEQMWVHTLEF